MEVEKQKIVSVLKNNYDGELTPNLLNINDKSWTIAELFIRQYLNNMCDGFGMKNVEKMYEYLYENKEKLIKYNLLSKEGTNSSGYPLWDNYELSPPNTEQSIISEETHNMLLNLLSN